MKKLGIITINDYTNLGNRLQNYAMQEILKEYGEVYTIRYFNKVSLYYKLYPRLRKIKRAFKCLRSLKIDHMRSKNFKKFNDKICFKYQFGKDKIKLIDNFFDYYIIGSDQIWNPNLYRNMEINFAKFTNKNKKIAVSPSISCDTLNSENYNKLKLGLEDFDYLSCRETQGASLIYDITGKNVSTLIDPTLMLSEKQWASVAIKPPFHNSEKKYVLLYFLGKITEEYSKTINRICDTFNLEVINIYDYKNIYYSCGPSEFIYLISHSELVLTDSFHGSVFSFIFDKPFRIFRRTDAGSMNSRLVNLLNVLNLKQNVYFDNDIDFSSLFETNYNKDILLEEQKKFLHYLSNIFD